MFSLQRVHTGGRVDPKFCTDLFEPSRIQRGSRTTWSLSASPRCPIPASTTTAGLHHRSPAIRLPATNTAPASTSTGSTSKPARPSDSTTHTDLHAASSTAPTGVTVYTHACYCGHNNFEDKNLHQTNV